MSKRNRRGRYRADLKEAMEDFELDWRDERDAALCEVKPQPEVETLRAELQTAKDRIATLEAERSEGRASFVRLLMWVFGGSAIAFAIGYIARIMTE